MSAAIQDRGDEIQGLQLLWGVSMPRPRVVSGFRGVHEQDQGFGQNAENRVWARFDDQGWKPVLLPC